MIVFRPKKKTKKMVRLEIKMTYHHSEIHTVAEKAEIWQELRLKLLWSAKLYFRTSFGTQ
jgi:hypothetical protein